MHRQAGHHGGGDGTVLQWGQLYSLKTCLQGGWALPPAPAFIKAGAGGFFGPEFGGFPGYKLVCNDSQHRRVESCLCN